MNSQTPTSSKAQLQAIHAMLSDGHKSICFETHTFLFWGVTAAFLILVVPELFSEHRFPESSQRMLFQNIFISVLLFATGVLDYHWTRKKRNASGKSLSFVQQQITKLWWMLVALVVVINIGMNIYGGGYLFYGITLILIGIGIYVHGLFSRQMLRWGGGLMIVLGLSLLGSSLNIDIQKWVAASAFGIGLPALAMMVNRTPETTLRREFIQSMIWFALVLTPTMIAVTLFDQSDFDNLPQISYQEYRANSLHQSDHSPLLVKLPTGMRIPLNVHIQGDALEQVGTTTIEMKTTQPVSVIVDAGEVQNQLRIGDGRWKSAYSYRVRDWKVKGSFSPNKRPELNLNFYLQFKD